MASEDWGQVNGGFQEGLCLLVEGTELLPQRGLRSRPPEVDDIPAAAEDAEDGASSTRGKDAITEALALVLTVQPPNQCRRRHRTACY